MHILFYKSLVLAKDENKEEFDIVERPLVHMFLLYNNDNNDDDDKDDDDGVCSS